jgi:CheY-specific phosphatase CheX
VRAIPLVIARSREPSAAGRAGSKETALALGSRAHAGGDPPYNVPRRHAVNSISATNNPDFELMDRHLMDVAVELFAAYEMAIEQCPASAKEGLGQETYCMASIGYVGQGVKGVLILAATRPAAEAWTSAAGGRECDLVDTVGEFSNMLLGRLKGRLLREGIPISLATPMTIVGAGLRFSMPPGRSSWHFFEGPGWQVGARLDAAFGPDFRRSETQVEPAEAGDAVLF